MATATYLKGDETTVEYLCPTTAAVVVGQIILCGTNGAISVGVAKNAITQSTTGVVSITGCYTFPAVTGAVIKAGESVDWDASAAKVEDNASTCVTGDVADFAIALQDKAAAATATTIKVMLTPPHAKT